MQLINTTTYQFKEFYDERNVENAILSHRWRDGQEILYKDMKSERRLEDAKKTAKFDKIRACCRQAASEKLQYVWIDTCCIDKSSSAELQESINSMFRWYQAAKVCYAYLFDVSDPTNGELNIQNSEWFKRGWTLQELLAPAEVVFYSQNWVNIGSRAVLRHEIASITGFPSSTLRSGLTNDHRILAAAIMSWANGRQTSRIEDRSYSLQGLFNVQMALLYGEGDAAFIRLQEEILKRSNDHSIFAWTGFTSHFTGALAPSPDFFSRSSDLQSSVVNQVYRSQPSSISSEGTSIALEMWPWAPNLYLGILNYDFPDNRNAHYNHSYRARHGIFLKPIQAGDITQQRLFARVKYRDRDLWHVAGRDLGHVRLPVYGPPVRRVITIVHRLRPTELQHFDYPSNHLNPENPRELYDVHLKSMHTVQTDEAGRFTPVSNGSTLLSRQQLSMKRGYYGWLGALKLEWCSTPVHGERPRIIYIGFDFNFDLLLHVVCNPDTWKTWSYLRDLLEEKTVWTETRATRRGLNYLDRRDEKGYTISYESRNIWTSETELDTFAINMRSNLWIFNSCQIPIYRDGELLMCLKRPGMGTGLDIILPTAPKKVTFDNSTG